MIISTIQFLIKGILAGILVSIPLGPMGIILIQRTVNKGVRSGFVSGLGVATADTFYAIVAIFGLTFLTNFLMSQLLSLKIIGGIIFLIMGIKFLTAKPKSFHNKNTIAKTTSGSLNKKSIVKDFLSMFVLTITNPLTIVLYGTVFATMGLGIIDHKPQTALSLTFGVCFGASLWWFALSSGVNLFRHKINLKRMYWLNRIMGVAIIALALVAAVSIFVS